MTDTSKVRLIPQQLRLRWLITSLLSLALAATGFLAYRAYAHVVQTIGRDSVPSIVAAQHIRGTLADAHTELINAFLNRESADGPSMQSYRKKLAETNDHLLDAAQNITYGDEERKPILAMMVALGEYETRVGSALSTQDNSDALYQADQIMRRSILPAARALDMANFEHMNTAYKDELAAAHLRLTIFGIVALCLAAGLLEAQLSLFRHFRRVLNLPMVVGSVICVAAATLVAIQATQVGQQIRAATEDAFDSIHALTQARAEAYSANAAESLFLVSTDPKIRTQQADLFQKSAAALMAQDMQSAPAIPANLKLLKGKGLLGDELANITFDGEEQHARNTWRAWAQYVLIDQRIRALESSGQHAQAVRLCLGEDTGQSDWQFKQFLDELDRTLKINQEAFDRFIAQAEAYCQRLWRLLLICVLAPLVGAGLGFQQRLKEFRE